MRRAINEIVNIQQYQADQKGIIIKVDFSQFQKRSGHSSLSQKYLIYSDQKRMQQVFLNLLSNALKFTKPKGSTRIRGWWNQPLLFIKTNFHAEIEINIKVKLKDDQKIQISVEDSGIGIPLQEQQKLFKMFGYL